MVAELHAAADRIATAHTFGLAAKTEGPALSTTQQVTVRLLEIDTPETKHPDKPVQCYGQKATEHLRGLVSVGDTVWVQRDEELPDQYDRHLLYLWTEQGTFVNLDQVRGGFARAKLYQPNDKHWDTIQLRPLPGAMRTAGVATFIGGGIRLLRLYVLIAPRLGLINTESRCWPR
ncbi:thermonuclease family protein [Actinopolyspora mortivallis]|uniref:thermonuclease family protein n=1 Tax=Actinopolyspora mortivallis TaxID=33906 RepID=UPI00037D93B5|nr:thermonuclease family protein [Actinopolyspora mortivallis]